MTLHFSYGANMDRVGMAKRCPGAKAWGRAFLDGYRFIIAASGYASVVRAPGAAVHGVLWRLTPRDVAALRIFESLDSGLYRSILMPVYSGSRRVRAVVYVGQEREGRQREGRPRPGYLEIVTAAAREWDLGADYIDSLRRWAPSAWCGKHPAETGRIR